MTYGSLFSGSPCTNASYFSCIFLKSGIFWFTFYYKWFGLQHIIIFVYVTSGDKHKYKASYHSIDFNTHTDWRNNIGQIWIIGWSDNIIQLLIHELPQTEGNQVFRNEWAFPDHTHKYTLDYIWKIPVGFHENVFLDRCWSRSGFW